MDMKAYFGGCSITMGAGYPEVQQDPQIYPNLVTPWATNDAEGGSSNLKIFVKAAKAIMDRTHNVYFVQWSALHRHWVYPSPKQGFYIGAYTDQNLVDQKFVAQYQLLNHDYGNIMSVIDYTRILQQMADDAGVDIWFINGMLPWTEDMLTQEEPSAYARELYLGLTQEEAANFAQQLTNNLELVDWNQWINPWQSIMCLKQDDAPLDDHPGPQTHQHIAMMIKDKLEQQ